MGSPAEKLTPQALRERAKRMIGAAVQDLVTAALEEGLSESEWVDQRSSPIGKRKHLELVREGKLVARKIGTRVLVRRDDLNRYIEEHGARRIDRAPEEEDVSDIVDSIVSGGSKRR